MKKIHPYYKAKKKGYDLTYPLDMWRWHKRQETRAFWEVTAVGFGIWLVLCFIYACFHHCK